MVLDDITEVPTVVLDCRNNLAESPVWDDYEARLYWVNIHQGEVWSWDPFGSSEPRVVPLNERVGAIGLRAGGGLVVALASGFALLSPDLARLRRLSAVEPECPKTRLNDGRVDPCGRFVCGGMDENSPQERRSALYALDPGLSVRRLLPGVACTNALCWSGDGRTLFFTDMPSRRIEAFNYDLDSGTLSGRRPFVSLVDQPGLADGAVVDADDYVWNAQWGGGRILRYQPDGRIDRQYLLPVSNPTSMAFGGPDLDILFVTTAWFGIDDAQRAGQPSAGSLFAFRPGVRGRAEYRFAG